MTTEEITRDSSEAAPQEEAVKSSPKSSNTNEDSFKKLPQSGFGIASFVLSILLLIFWLFFIISSVVIAQTNTYGPEGFSMLQVMKGFSLKGFITAGFGLMLAVAGLLSKGKNKTSVFWGLGINGVLSLIFLFIVFASRQAY